MSTQIEINESLIKYLQKTGYRPDPIIDRLEKETSLLGGVSQMQIAKEQGQFLEIIAILEFFSRLRLFIISRSFKLVI